eukprot:3277166-Prymnesium_polylepis.1
MHRIHEALTMTAAEQAGALGMLTQQSASRELDAQRAESAAALSREELELMARELEAQASASEHEHE